MALEHDFSGAGVFSGVADIADIINQRHTNLVFFPDWSQPEQLLCQELATVIANMVNHTAKKEITLFISTGFHSEAEANLLLSDVVMNLFLEKDLDVADGPVIILVGQLYEEQWKTLLSRSLLVGSSGFQTIGGKFPESRLAHKYLDGLKGIEIGGSAHNPFGLDTLNVDYTDNLTTIYKQAEVKQCGEVLKVDVVARGDDLPFGEETLDFVISAHVIEHFYDPIKAIEEWLRVIRKGGYIFIIAPHKKRTFDKDRPRTTLVELIDRQKNPDPLLIDKDDHHSVWITEDFIELCSYHGWNVVESQDVDDKVGDAFTIVIQKA